MLSEERQTDKDKYYMISLYVEPKKNDANEPLGGSVVGAHGLVVCGSQALEHGLPGCGTQA